MTEVVDNSMYKRTDTYVQSQRFRADSAEPGLGAYTLVHSSNSLDQSSFLSFDLDLTSYNPRSRSSAYWKGDS